MEARKHHSFTSYEKQYRTDCFMIWKYLDLMYIHPKHKRLYMRNLEYLVFLEMGRQSDTKRSSSCEEALRSEERRVGKEC